MAGGQRDRRRAPGQQRRAAAAAAAKRRQKRKQMTFVGVSAGVVVVGLVAVLLLTSGGGGKKKTAAASSTTAPSSTEAKDCVAVTDPLPTGAPAVPVKVGPAPTELIKEDLKVGDGTEVTAGETVTVNYIGATCTTGKIFDSSYSRGQPATFSLNGVIKGWTDGIPGMKVGGQRLLGIPADQAYGASGQGADIGPNEPLWFVVEVTDAKPA